MAVGQKISEYIRCHVAPVEVDAIGEDDNLIEEGMIDSLGIVQLLEYISQEFSVDVDADEIQPENFSTVRAIEALIVKKQG